MVKLKKRALGKTNSLQIAEFIITSTQEEDASCSQIWTLDHEASINSLRFDEDRRDYVVCHQKVVLFMRLQMY
ncbi:hypothetical protein H5410_056047 [Solanum commersonii]|uniref:Uncharacterized protein n=1 Tax=Solanum commersonii TaxID=4109 RepID=A0A9J5WJ77_SOLCO|nr:hypothetical protein H5410_056047 [Solanum commersonii]